MASPFIDYSSGIWNFIGDRVVHSVLFPKQDFYGRVNAMRKTLMALAAAASLVLSAVAMPAPAHAQRGFGAGLAAGVIGGAIVGGALAAPYYYGPRYYGPGYGYYGPGYGYYGPSYVAGPGYGGCYWQRQRFWDGYGWRIRNVRVCG
jgi:hypothetical protein